MLNAKDNTLKISQPSADFRRSNFPGAVTQDATLGKPQERIPHSIAVSTETDLAFLKDAIERKQLSGNGFYTNACSELLRNKLSCDGQDTTVLLTQSCTAALEMAAILCELKEGDEVIMPSYTFVSTANAVVLRGAKPVFVDIRTDTLNIDEQKIEAAVTEKTRAIFVVHYAGVACHMKPIMELAEKYNLIVVEDAAQALCSTYMGRQLGAIGHLGCFSFHATKNVISGEGGALAINDKRFRTRAAVIWEKGTNRRQFFAGEADKYTWVDIGSSFLPSELTAAYLYSQLLRSEAITEERRRYWNSYYAGFADLEARRIVVRPKTQAFSEHNAHIFYLLLRDTELRDQTISALAAINIVCPFHYVPLHSSPAGERYGKTCGSMAATESASSRLIRLPLWIGMGEKVDTVISEVVRFLSR